MIYPQRVLGTPPLRNSSDIILKYSVNRHICICIALDVTLFIDCFTPKVIQ